MRKICKDRLMAVRVRCCAVLFVVCSVAVATPISASTTSIGNIPFLEKYDKAAGPGLAVLVVQDGQILHRRGYGLANLKTRERIMSDSNFQLASLTKQFTALAIALLIERGVLSYKERLGVYFPEFSGSLAKVQVRHLIHHTSGLPDYASLCQGREKVTNADVINYLRSRKLNFKSGGRFEYSNTGYVVLATLIERISGQSFPDFLQKEIFSRIGMTNTAVFHTDGPPITRQVVAYDGWPYFHELNSSPCNYLYGGGRVFSSLTDLTLWIRDLERSSIASRETLKNIFSPTSTNKGIAVPYGFGWRIDSYLGEPFYWHEGKWLGFRSYIGHLPRRHLWVVILANFSSASLEDTFQMIVSYYSSRQQPNMSASERGE